VYNHEIRGNTEEQKGRKTNQLRKVLFDEPLNQKLIFSVRHVPVYPSQFNELNKKIILADVSWSIFFVFFGSEKLIISENLDKKKKSQQLHLLSTMIQNKIFKRHHLSFFLCF
jgi:hypothetical protein